MELPLPFRWHIVCISYDVCHEPFRIEYRILLRYKTSCGSKNGTKDTEVEQKRAMRRNFEVKCKFRIDHGCQKQHSCKGATDERYESICSSSDGKIRMRIEELKLPHDKRKLLVRKLSDVHVR